MLLNNSPAISLVLPCDSNIQRFEDTLASVLRYLPTQTQVVVVHDGSYANPHDLDEVDFVVASDCEQLGGMLGAALRVASAPVVGMIRSGVQLDEGWQESILEAFEGPGIASVSPAIVSEQKPNRLLVAGVESGKAFKRKLVGGNVRLGRKASRLKPLAPSSWAGFYRRDVLDMLGTPDSQLETLFLDLDLGLGIRQLGYKNAFQQECVFTIEDPSLISSEATQAHGLAAARAKVRFGDRSSLLGESLLELMSVPFKPWHFKHVLGKLSARGMLDIDEAYWRRLLQKTQELRAVESRVLAMPQADVDEGDRFRRAA